MLTLINLLVVILPLLELTSTQNEQLTLEECFDKYERGIYPHEDDCTKFLSCATDEPLDCPAGLHFNPTEFVCDWPANAGCMKVTTPNPEPENDSKKPDKKSPSDSLTTPSESPSETTPNSSSKTEKPSDALDTTTKSSTTSEATEPSSGSSDAPTTPSEVSETTPSSSTSEEADKSTEASEKDFSSATTPKSSPETSEDLETTPKSSTTPTELVTTSDSSETTSKSSATTPSVSEETSESSETSTPKSSTTPLLNSDTSETTPLVSSTLPSESEKTSDSSETTPKSSTTPNKPEKSSDTSETTPLVSSTTPSESEKTSDASETTVKPSTTPNKSEKPSDASENTPSTTASESEGTSEPSETTPKFSTTPTVSETSETTPLLSSTTPSESEKTSDASETAVMSSTTPKGSEETSEPSETTPKSSSTSTEPEKSSDTSETTPLISSTTPSESEKTSESSETTSKSSTTVPSESESPSDSSESTPKSEKTSEPSETTTSTSSATSPRESSETTPSFEETKITSEASEMTPKSSTTLTNDESSSEPSVTSPSEPEKEETTPKTTNTEPSDKDLNQTDQDTAAPKEPNEFDLPPEPTHASEVSTAGPLNEQCDLKQEGSCSPPKPGLERQPPAGVNLGSRFGETTIEPEFDNREPLTQPPPSGFSIKKCLAQHKFGIFAHPSSPNKFFICTKSRPLEMTCPLGLEFDQAIYGCGRPKMTTTPPPPEYNLRQCLTQYPRGLFSHPTECAKFYACTKTGPIVMSCPQGLHFNPMKLVCDWPSRYCIDPATKTRNSILKAMKGDHIVPDLIDRCPDKLAEVAFPSGGQANLGQELTPSQTLKPPSIYWEADHKSFYTLCMVDPDAPKTKPSQPNQINHWTVGNIPGNQISRGQPLTEYLPPCPQRNSPPHRYTYMIYRQPGRINFQEPRIPANSFQNRDGFSLRNFVERYQLGNPIAGNYFKCRWDQSVPMIMQKLQHLTRPFLMFQPGFRTNSNSYSFSYSIRM